ncbi:EpsG family protein [Cetobacterium somerae]
MKKIMEILMVLIIFIINPFIGFIISLYKAIKNKNNNKYLIIISIYYGFFGLLFLSKEAYDIRVHYQIFSQIVVYSNREFYEFLLKEKDWVIFIFYKILSCFTTNPRWIGFFSALISYGIPFYLIIDYSHRKKMKSSEIFLFLFLFLGIFPSYMFSGMRNFNAVCLFSLGIYIIDVLKNKKGYILIIISSLLHISLLILCIIFIASKFIKITKIKIVLSSLVTLILIIFSKKILLLSLKLVPKYSKILEPYILGEHAIDIAEGWAIVLISYAFSLGVVIIFYICSLKTKKKLIFGDFLICYLPIISIFSFSKTMYARYISNIKIILLMILIQIYLKVSNGKKILFVSILIYSILGYLTLVKIEWETWNFNLLSGSIISIMKEKNNLNQPKYLELIRE